MNLSHRFVIVNHSKPIISSSNNNNNDDDINIHSEHLNDSENRNLNENLNFLCKNEG